eukprot:TRINITY_DN8925_c0_g1_i1.p1 TRINITY_DN8925_c0_g1~~TRINITY_DN8925_c0_g1_i1.p1  ORF type:complete len:292 (-),score=58.65 TRINITY_DN8925_c0_g1_i1:197-1072(-)
MAAGAKLPVQRFLVNQLREELSQWLDKEFGLDREGHCTDAYAMNKTGKVALLGHNDDWSVYWRNQTYFVVATALDAHGAAKFKFGTWVYPGYLVGEQLNWNSYGLLWTCNSLFPKDFFETGVGTAWVARHMLEATSIEELVKRAANSEVSTAMNYNLGRLATKELWNLEVNSRGVHALQQIHGAHVHTNQFKLMNDVSQFPEKSSAHREARWAELRPNDADSVRSFLSDRKDPEWPVWRNRTGDDKCYTQVTALFDLEKASLSVWTIPSSAAAPEMELSLIFPEEREELLV